MKCRRNKCILKQEACILRQEIVELLNFEGKQLKTFSKCENCKYGQKIKREYPIIGLDNDVFSLMLKYIKLKKPKLKNKKETKNEKITKLTKVKLNNIKIVKNTKIKKKVLKNGKKEIDKFCGRCSRREDLLFG